MNTKERIKRIVTLIPLHLVCILLKHVVKPFVKFGICLKA